MKKLPIIPTLMVLAFVVLMLNLGFWQLNRAEEKEKLLLLLADDKLNTITQGEQIKQLPQYANVELHGHFLQSPQLLLDNQVDEQRIGYHVFTPFFVENIDVYILINRGWVAKDNFNPDVLAVDTKPFSLTGKLNHAPQVGIQLGQITLEHNLPVQAMAYFDREIVASFLYENLCTGLNCVVSDKVLLLDKAAKMGFKRTWKPVVMLPEKHIGYAVQWFLMTFALLLLYLYWLRKQHILSA